MSDAGQQMQAQTLVSLVLCLNVPVQNVAYIDPYPGVKVKEHIFYHQRRVRRLYE